MESNKNTVQVFHNDNSSFIKPKFLSTKIWQKLFDKGHLPQSSIFHYNDVGIDLNVFGQTM